MPNEILEAVEEAITGGEDLEVVIKFADEHEQELAQAWLRLEAEGDARYIVINCGFGWLQHPPRADDDGYRTEDADPKTLGQALRKLADVTGLSLETMALKIAAEKLTAARGLCPWLDEYEEFYLRRCQHCPKANGKVSCWEAALLQEAEAAQPQAADDLPEAELTEADDAETEGPADPETQS